MHCHCLQLSRGWRSRWSACTQVLTNYHPFIDPEPSNPPFAVKASVYIREQFFYAVALRAPTASPVPTIVSGAITFETENLLSTAVEVNILCALLRHCRTLPAQAGQQAVAFSAA